MGRTSGAKSAAEYFGGLRKAPSSDKSQPSGLRRFFGFLAPSNTRSSAEAPSARASASFLLPWRSQRGPADVLAVDQGTPSFDALRLEDRWESTATDILAAAREAPPSRQGEEESEDDEVEREIQARIRQQRRSLAQQREDNYRAQPEKQAQQPEKQAHKEFAAPELTDEERRREEEEQAQAQRRMQMAKLQELQRQATLRDKERDGEEDKPVRLEYQAWEAPLRTQTLGRHTFLPSTQQQQQQQQQGTPPKLEYSASHRHLDLTPHPPPPQTQLQSQSAKLLHIHQHSAAAANSSGSLQAARAAGSDAGSSRELLRLPPCTQTQQQRQEAAPLVFRERAVTMIQTGDGPLSGAGSKSRRFLEISAAAAAEEEARCRSGVVSRDWAEEDEEDDQPSGRPTGSFDRAPGVAGRSFRRGVFSDAGEARFMTPNRLPAGPSGRWPGAQLQVPSPAPASPATAGTSAAASPAGTTAPPPLLRRDSSVRFSVASIGTSVSHAPSTSTAAGTSFSAVSAYTVAAAAAGDNASPSRRVSNSGHDSMVRRTALLREACNGANSMRAKMQHLHVSSNGTAGPRLPGAGSVPPTEDLDLALERSLGGSGLPPALSTANSVSSGASGRVSNPGVWPTQVTALSVRVRRDLGNRAAAEEASVAATAPVSRPAMPRWQETLMATSAALDGSGGSSQDLTAGSPTVRPRSGDVFPGAREDSGVQSAVGEAECAGSGTNSGQSSAMITAAAAPPRPLQRADTCRDRGGRAVTPAARTGRVLQRANTQPAKVHSRFSYDGDLEATDDIDSVLAEAAPPAPAAPAAPPAPPAAVPVGGSPRAGRRANGPAAPIAPVPPPQPRSVLPGSGAPPPLRRISEASGGHSTVLPTPPPPVAAGPGGSPSLTSATSVGSGSGASASPRVAALAERVRERSITGAPSPPPPPLPPSGATQDSAPVLLSATSFGRRGAQLIDPLGAASVSPRRPPRASSPASTLSSSRSGLPGASGLGAGSATSQLPPPMASCRVSVPNGAVAGNGLYDGGLDPARPGGPLAGAGGWQRKGLEGDAGAAGSASAASAALDPVRASGSGSGVLAMPRPRRLADVRAAVMGTGAAGGGSWPLPPH